MTDASRNYWLGVVSRAHVQLGVEGGFVQLNHGKKAPVQRMGEGDGIVLYSPRTAYPDAETLQHFTAIGTVVSGVNYQHEVTPDFRPYRPDVRYMPSHEAPIKPLIKKLSFIKDKANWGSSLRFGHLKISAEDFQIIAEAMGAEG